ncbi:putative glycoside hydrolase family 15 protein [Halobacillus litoralis]|uniref:putative glycoside hydrolase n=1 Tax=Halobacillus litoralis TaxID=45668 RepID=UPI001CD5B05E|nr:endo alpha-1,4 polygalactosaminidase [Halobacillus litoralis]MCA0972055.1 putative glycoside hydrolase family 15 protein [Halobacillus litoralis]
MKTFIRLSVMSSLLLLSSAIFYATKPNATEQSQLQKVYDYKIYYDSPTPDILDKMGSYDLVIIEPVFYSPDQIERIREQGTLVYGYINTMEADNWNTSFIEQLNEDDFFHRDGKRVYYPQWDSYLTDITSPHYQQVLQAEVDKQIISKNLDGVFLDTVGNIDNEHSDNAEILYEQRQGMVSWMESVQEQHPGISMIQNWGFDTLTTSTHPYVEAIMWESFHFSNLVGDEWAHDQIYKLRKAREEHGIQVLTVANEEKKQSEMLSRANRFIHYHDVAGYNEW